MVNFPPKYIQVDILFNGRIIFHMILIYHNLFNKFLNNGHLDVITLQGEVLNNAEINTGVL